MAVDYFIRLDQFISINFANNILEDILSKYRLIILILITFYYMSYEFMKELDQQLFYSLILFINMIK